MILWHKHCDIFDVWLCEGVIYHTSDGIPSLMTTYGSPISPLISFYALLRTDIDTLNTLYDLKVAYRNRRNENCIQEQQQETPRKAGISRNCY
jgi:hypothetical protein